MEWRVRDCDYGLNSVITTQITLAAGSVGEVFSSASWFFLSLCCTGSSIPCEDLYRFSGESSTSIAFREASPGTAVAVYNTSLTFCSSLTPSAAMRSCSSPLAFQFGSNLTSTNHRLGIQPIFLQCGPLPPPAGVCTQSIGFRQAPFGSLTLTNNFPGTLCQEFTGSTSCGLCR